MLKHTLVFKTALGQPRSVELTEDQIKNLFRWKNELLTTTVPQTQGALYKKDERGIKSYCCVGLACELLNITNTPLHDIPHPERSVNFAALPLSSHIYHIFTQANDDQGLSFKEIAETYLVPALAPFEHLA